MTRGRVAAVVLAAGTASRFGATKQVAPLDGEPLVAHVAAAAVAGGVDEVVVVVGHDGDRVAAAVAGYDQVRVVHNDRYRAGQSTSLHAGIDALDATVAAAVVLLADQPGIEAAAIAAVVAAWRGGAAVARARYADGRGHPVIFDRSTWPRLRSVAGDRGARDLLAADHVTDVAVPGRVPPDVDRASDLDDLIGR